MSDNSGGTMADNASAVADNTSNIPKNNGSIFNNYARAVADNTSVMADKTGITPDTTSASPDNASAIPINNSMKKPRLSNTIVEAETPKWQSSKKRRTKKPNTEPAELRRSQRANRGQRNIRAIVHYTEVSDSPVKTENAFPILALPREIRDMIYDRLFDKVIIQARSYGMKFRAAYGSEGSGFRIMTTQGLPKWLSSNR
jgi:hypothetical protein